MNNRIVHALAHFFLISGTLLLWHGSSAAAPPSFELDPKELETAAPSIKAPKHPAGRPHRKQATKSDETAGHATVTEGDERLVRYTVKPGDFLFRILMREFGLSNAEAEALIPEVRRINHLASATRLEVGRTLLIPRGKRKLSARKVTRAVIAPAAAPATEVPPPEPVPAAKPLPSPPPAETGTPPSSREHEVEAPRSAAAAPAEPAKRAEEPSQPPPSPATVLFRLWEQLVPDQGRVEPITLGGRVLPPEEYPLLLAADGGKILVDLRGSLNGAAKSQLVQKYPDLRVLPRGSEGFREFFTDLLRTAEFARIEENPTVELGADPRLAVRADFRITALTAAGHGPESILIFVDGHGPSLPPPLKEYLSRKGYRVAELSRREAPRSDEPGYDLRFLPPAPPCEMALSLLEILSLKLDRNRIVTGSMGQNAESRFSIRVDGLFETGGKRFILDCGENDSYNYTLYRLLQLQGYGIVQPQPKDDSATVTEKLMKELNYPFSFGRYDFDYGHYRISVTGFKIARRGDSTGRLLLVNKPSDPVFAELLQSAPTGK